MFYSNTHAHITKTFQLTLPEIHSTVSTLKKPMKLRPQHHITMIIRTSCQPFQLLVLQLSYCHLFFCIWHAYMFCFHRALHYIIHSPKSFMVKAGSERETYGKTRRVRKSCDTHIMRVKRKRVKWNPHFSQWVWYRESSELDLLYFFG